MSRITRWAGTVAIMIATSAIVSALFTYREPLWVGYVGVFFASVIGFLVGLMVGIEDIQLEVKKIEAICPFCEKPINPKHVWSYCEVDGQPSKMHARCAERASR